MVTAENKIVFPAGSPIPLPVMIFGYLLIFIGIGLLGELPLVALAILLLGGYLGFQFQGAEINLETRQMRQYTSYLSVRFGKWRDLADFPFITVLRRKTTERTYAMTANFVEVKKSFFSICLLNQSHHTRIVLVNIEGEEAALTKAKELAEKLNLEITGYNPKLSEASKMKRGRRK